MKFRKEDMIEMLDDMDDSPLRLIEDKTLDNSRWAIRHRIVFEDKETGKFYSSYYRVGATEMQDESPWQYDGDEIEVEEVKQVEKTILTWEKI